MDPLTLGLAASGGTAIAGAWISARYAWWRKTAPWKWPRILMYHMVCPHRPGGRFNGLRVDPKLFDAQIRWLREDGWTFLTMRDVTKSWGTTPEKSVVITFDDGYADNLLAALPILSRYDAHATLYLVHNRFGTDWSVKKKAHHTGNELGEEPKLTDGQVRDMLESGRIELGSHTLSHPNFSRLNDKEKREELTASKQALEHAFQVPVTSFAYPFGIYMQGDETLVKEAGYSNAVTTDTGIDCTPTPKFHRLKRIKIGGKESLSAFRLRLRTGWSAWNK